MKTEPDSDSVIILPDDDMTAIARKKINLLAALEIDPLEALRRAYEIARQSGAAEEEERLCCAINRPAEIRKLQMGQTNVGTAL